MAAKLARLVYRMLRYGMKYVHKELRFMTRDIANKQVIHLKRKAAQLGLEVVEAVAA